MRLLLINPNISDSLSELIPAEALRIASSDTEIEVLTASLRIDYIETRFEALIGACAAAELPAAHHERFDAVIVAACGDDGLAGLREASPCPVTGLTEAALACACLLGQPFSIIAISQRISAWYRETVEHYGLAGRLASIRGIDENLADIGNVQDNKGERLVKLAESCIGEDGADVIVLAGAPLAGLDCSLRGRLPVPSVGDVPSAVRHAETPVALQPAVRRAAASRSHPSNQIKESALPSHGYSIAVAAPEHRAHATSMTLFPPSHPAPLKDPTMIRKNRFSTLFAATAAALALFAPLAAQAQDHLTYKVIGQPAATGLIQKNKEKPFFDEFAKRTGLPIDADYKPMDSLGIKDTEQLRVVKAGLFDIVSLRMSQNSRDEPALLGMDLVGASPDYATARKVYEAYRDTLDQRLQKSFQVKLLGVWPFGPQILFCNKPITQLADLKGLKVRVYDQNLSKFIEKIGGTPVPLSFIEVQQSLSLGVVDCAITGPSSANAGNWPEVTTRQYPLGFQMSVNAYVITLKAWNKLSADQKTKMQAAFTTLTDDIWTYSQELTQDAINCNAGKDPCTMGKKFSLVNVPVTAADKEAVRNAVTTISLPTWADICDKSYPGCSDAWKKTVGKAIGVQ